MSKILRFFHTCDFAEAVGGGVREDDGVASFDRGDDVVPELIDIFKR